MVASRRLVVLALLTTSVVRSVNAVQPNDGELRLKAAFVFHFPQFVAWPTAAVEGKKLFELCVAQPDSVAGFLEELVTGEAVNGRPIRIARLSSADDILDCDALAILGTPDAVGPLMRQAIGRPVLTIGDSDRFLEHGGIIALRVVNQRVRFEVDVANAQRAGLQLSSHLLRLALSVRGGPS